MKLRKFGILCLVVIILTGMIGCSKNSNNDDQKSNKKEKIVIGTSASYKPWAFQENDKIKGFEIDIWNEIAKRNNIDVEFKLGQFSGLVGMLDAGEIDTVAHQMSITDERKKKISYTDSYLQNKQIVVTMSDSNVKTKADLKDKEVGTQQGSTALDAIEKDKAFMDTLKGGAPVLYDTYDKALRDLEIGRTDAVVGDEVLVRYYMSQKGEEKYKVLDEDFGLEDYVVATAKDNKELSVKINEKIKEMKDDGTFEQIYKKWFK